MFIVVCKRYMWEVSCLFESEKFVSIFLPVRSFWSMYSTKNDFRTDFCTTISSVNRVSIYQELRWAPNFVKITNLSNKDDSDMRFRFFKSFPSIDFFERHAFKIHVNKWSFSFWWICEHTSERKVSNKKCNLWNLKFWVVNVCTRYVFLNAVL